MCEERFILRADDLRAISELIIDNYDNSAIRKRYSYIISLMADSLLSDDAIIVRDCFFSREHGV